MFYQKRFRKVLSALLAFAMLFTCAGVFAIDADGTTSTGDIEVNAKVEPNLNLEAGLETDNVEDLRIPEDFETVDEPVLEADVLKEISANLGVSPGEKAGRKTSTYDYPIHPDPNLVTDEEFFGKWNGEKWTVKPYFNYEGYPDLEFVEEAVKAGSYDEAKVALMNYYVELEAKRDRPKKTTTSKTDILNAHMLEENFMYNIRSGMIITDIVKFGPEPKEVPIDITDHISNKKGISKQIAFVLTATNMDGSKIRINSDDNPNFKPYINIVVNGTSLKVPVEYGTYISAGANVSKNYCTEDYLYAQESGQPLDSNSKRIYIKADIDMLKTNDVLETATLNLYGCNDGGTDEKELAVFKTDDTAWEEDNLKWNKSGLLQMMFSYDQLDTMPWVQPEYGTYRYEEELFRFDTWLDKLVATYNTTGDEKYAYTALRWVVDYIKVRGSNPSHKKLLDRAVRMQVIPGYFLELINCRSMTPEVFTTILKYMWAMGNASIPLKGDANWGTSECQGLYTLCVNFAEFNDSPKWFDAVGARYDVLCDQQLLDDMSCHEIPLGYTDYTLNTLIGAKKVADVLKTEYPYKPFTLNVIHKLTKYMMFASGPGFVDHQQGDGYSHRGGYSGRLDFMAKWFNDEQLQYGATKGEQGKIPEFTSHVYPGTGKKTVFRTGWGNKDYFMHLNADGGQGNHAHQDDLSMTIFANGRYLLVDPLYGSYNSSDPVRQWLISVKGHNTIRVNGQGQTKSKSGSLEAFETNNLYDFVRMSTPNTPAALKHERNSMFMRSNFWVVSDYIVPKDITKDNKYEQYWHMLPEANITMEDSTKTVRTNFQDANIQVVPVEYGKYNRSEILEGWYSEGQNNSMKADYVEYERNNKGATSFTTVLFPNDIGKDYAIQTEPINLALDDESANAFTMNVTENNTGISQDYTYYILNERSRKEKVKVNNYSIDGELMMVESNIETKKPVMFTGRNFTEFSDGDKIMVKATKPVEDIGISWSGSTIELSSSVVETKQHVLDYEEDVLASKKNGQSLEKLKNLTIRANGKVDKVLYNGEVIKFKQSGNYVYFGENPIIDDKTPVPTPSAKPDSPSGGSGGGSGNGGGAGGNVVIPPISSVKPSESPEISPKPTQSPAPVVPEDLKKELVGHWAEKEISELIDKGLVNGSDGSLQLETKITRAEFISMLNRATKVEKAGYLGTKSDVALNDWYADDIQTALNAGYLSDESTTVRPNDFITREEMTKIAVIAYESVTENVITPSDINFTDNEEISDWAVEYVKKSTEAKIINGFEDNTFRPKANTLREQAMVVIYRLLEDLAI